MNPANSQEALAQLQQQQQAAQNPNDILSAQRQQLGAQGAQDTVTGLRGQINNTTKLLKQVAPSVMGRTQGSLVTSAQAGRIIQNEQAPISQNLTELGGQYNEASTQANQLENQAAQAAQGIYAGQQDRMSYLQNLYNTLYEREQQAEAARQAELDRQEQIRQFNASLRKSGSGGSGFNLTTGGGGGSTTAPSAAAQTGSLRDRWQQEAGAGDWNAQVALNYAGNDGRYDGPVNSQSELDILRSMGIQGNYYVPKQAGPGLFSAETGAKITGGAKNLLNSAANRLKSNAGIFGS